MQLKRSVIDAGAKVASALAVSVAAILMVSEYVSTLTQSQQLGLQVAVPMMALLWAMLVPSFQTHLQSREARRRREHERDEIRRIAASLSDLAVKELVRIRAAMEASMTDMDNFTMPGNHIDRHLSALSQFNADNLPNAQALIALEGLRDKLRNCLAVIAKAPAGPPFGPAAAYEIIRDITPEIEEAEKLVTDIATASW